MCRGDSINSNFREELHAKVPQQTDEVGELQKKSLVELKNLFAVQRERNDQQQVRKICLTLGHVCKMKQEYETAIEYYREALEMVPDPNDERQEKNAYLELAECYMRTEEIQMAIEYYEKALKVKEKDIYKERVIYIRLAYAYTLNHQMKQTNEYLGRALKIAKDCGDKQEEGAIYLRFGDALCWNGEYQEAIDYYEKALKIARECKNNQYEQEIYHRLTEVYTLSNENTTNNNIKRANEYCPMASKPGNPDIYLALGDIYKFKNKFEEAIEAYKKALHETIKINNEENLTLTQTTVHIYLKLADAHSLTNEFEEAIKSCNKALEVAEEKWQRKKIYLQFGEVYKLHNEIKMAKEYYEKALTIDCKHEEEELVQTEMPANLQLEDIYRIRMNAEEAVTREKHMFQTHVDDLKNAKKGKDTRKQKEGYLKLGHRHRINKDIPTAIKYFKKALSCIKELGDTQEEVNAYLELGNAYGLNNQTQMSIDSFHKALEAARERQDIQQETNAYLGLGNVYMMDKAIETTETAEKYFNKGLKLAKERRDAQQEANAYLGLGFYYRSSSQSQKEVEYFEKAVKTAEERGDTQQVTQAYLGLGVSYRSSGQSQKANECFEKAFVLKATGPSFESIKFIDREKPYKTNLKEQDIKLAEHDCCKLEATRLTGVDQRLGEAIDDRVKCLEITKHTITVAEHSGEEYKFPSACATTLKTEPKRDGVSQDVKNTWFEDTFLNSKHKLKKEIHEKLRSFPWLCGAYGLAGSNKKINHLHIYLTVKRGMKKCDVRRDLREKFNCDAKEYFELLQEPKHEPRIKFLVRDRNTSSVGAEALPSITPVTPKPGGGLLACSGQTGHNYTRMPEENEAEGDLPDMQGTGTLTMFCCKDGQHYALTCFHVACASDENSCDAAFNNTSYKTFLQKVKKIRESPSHFQDQAKEKEYYFIEGKEDNNNEAILYGHDGRNCSKLGNFANSRFDEECDIMSLKIPNGVQFSCKIAGVTSPDWVKITDELFERVFDSNKKDLVEVEKNGFSSALTKGYIFPYDFSYSMGEDFLFEDAYVVTGYDGPFLKDGDSGSLVFFHDKDNRKQAFAYGVCEVSDDLLPKLKESTSFPSEMHKHALSKEGELTSSISREHVCSEQHDLAVLKPVEQAIPEQKVAQIFISQEHTLQEQPTSEDDSDSCSTWSDESDDGGILFREESDANETSKKGPYSVCLRLDTALENLGLLEATCFSDCANSRR